MFCSLCYPMSMAPSIRVKGGRSFCLDYCSTFLLSWCTVKKSLPFSHPQPGCNLPNSPWNVIIKLFPSRERLVSDIPAGDGKIVNLFFTVCDLLLLLSPLSLSKHFSLVRFSRVTRPCAARTCIFRLINIQRGALPTPLPGHRHPPPTRLYTV
jgi:hypothetical protein